MRYYIAVFRSRSNVLNFANLLRTNSVPCAIIGTPSKLGKTCGLSVKFLYDYFPKVQRLIKEQSFCSFDGFYEITETFNGNNIKRI